MLMTHSWETKTDTSKTKSDHKIENKKKWHDIKIRCFIDKYNCIMDVSVHQMNESKDKDK